MKKSKALAALLLVVLLFCTGCGKKEPASQTELLSASDSLYVTDNAQILSAETEERIVNQVRSLKQQCGAEIALVTVDFLPRGLDAEEFACELLNDWGVGDAERNNGVLLALVPGEGKGWITVGYGIEGSLTAGTLEGILNRYLWDDFDAGRYDRAARNTVDALIGWFEGYYHIAVSATGQAAPQPTSFGGGGANETSDASSEGHTFLLLVILLLLFLCLRSGGGRRRSFFFFPIHFGFPRTRPPFGGGGFGGGFGGGHGGGFGGGFGGGGGRGGGAGRR